MNESGLSPVTSRGNAFDKRGVRHTTPNPSLFTLIKFTQTCSQNRHSSPIRTIAGKFSIPPRGFSSISDFFDVIDETSVRLIANGEYNDLALWETADRILQENYGIDVSLHVVRKRLWALTLRHVIAREKTPAQIYHLHKKWEQQVLEALASEDVDVIARELGK